MQISVIGLGKLGSPLLAVLAASGFQVIGTDANENLVRMIQAHQAPVSEPQLQEFLTRFSGQITATSDIAQAIAASEVTFIVVPTPSLGDGLFSLEYVQAVITKVGQALRGQTRRHLVVVCSTVMPRSMDEQIAPLLAQTSGRKIGQDLGLCYNPEFIALGSVIRDMQNPDMVLIGESDETSGALLEEIQRKICRNQPQFHRTRFVNAELTKIAINTFVTTRISYANMLTELCETLPGADVQSVTEALGKDSRIGPKYLKGGLSYGGPCFPRDNVALAALADKQGVPAWLPKATDQVNRHQIQRLAQRLEALTPVDSTILLLGMSYKPGSVVVEQSAGLLLVPELLKRRRRVIVHDPIALGSLPASFQQTARVSPDLAEALPLADALVVMTPWPEYQKLSPELIHAAPHLKLILDPWRLWTNWSWPAGQSYQVFGQGPALKD